MRASYSRHDEERILPQRPKSALSQQSRTAFARDRARVLHSSALRRLGAKTQVLRANREDFARTRLTHSLEVAQVGRELAKMLGADPDIVDTACLSHDLGHPPFGHNGERALAEVAKGYGGFEGNAQTLRILTRLEPKVSDGDRPLGLNLTRATLDACIKYPWALGDRPGPKFGVYEDDRPAFDFARDGAVAGRKCVEAQIMDLSDDIGYSVHDIEDAVSLGIMDPDVTAHSDEQLAQIFADTRAWYGEHLTDDLLFAALARLTKHPWWLTSFDGGYAALAALKDMTSHLIGRFVSNTVLATRDQHGRDPIARYGAQLVIPSETASEIALLKGLAAHYVMIPRELDHGYLQERVLIFDLAHAMLESGPSSLEPIFATYWHEHNDDAGKVRAVVDQIASLTDMTARTRHSSLCGMFSE